MSVYVNGVDLATFGFVYTRREGDLTPAVGRAPAVPVPGGFGERATGADAALAPRTIRILGTVIADAPGQFVANVRALAYHCTGGAGGPTSADVTLSFGAEGTTPAVAYTAQLDAATTFDRFDPQELATAGALTLVFGCADPRGVDATATTLPLGATPQAVPVGTARVRPRTTLAGPLAGAVTLTQTTAAGTTVGSLTLTIPSATVLSGHTVEIDHAAETVTWVHGGTRASRPAWLTAGDFLACDPAHVVSDSGALVASAAEGEGDVDGPRGVARSTAFEPAWQDRFGTDTSGGYTLQTCTLAWQGTSGAPTGTGVMRSTNTAGAGQLDVPWPATLPGAQYPYVVLRYRVVSGSPAVTVYFTTASHGISGAYQRGATLTPDAAWHTLVLDMRQLTAGGDDWAASSITGLSLLVSGVGAIVDWNAIAVASAGPTRGVGRLPSRLALSTGTGTVTVARGWR